MFGKKVIRMVVEKILNMFIDVFVFFIVAITNVLVQLITMLMAYMTVTKTTNIAVKENGRTK